MRINFGNIFLALLLAGLSCGTTQMRGSEPPLWLSGSSPKHPSSFYLTAIGEGVTAKDAEADAYAGISKIFQVKVKSQEESRERYVQKNAQVEEHKFTIESSIDLSTQKVLSQVRIAQVYQDPDTGRYYALAVLDRDQVGTSLKEKIGHLDREIEHLLRSKGEGKLEKIKILKKAMDKLRLREVLNSDLRVVDAEGKGVKPGYDPGKLARRFEEGLRGLFIKVEIEGDYGEELAAALTELLVNQGLSVAPEGKPADILIKGRLEWERSGISDRNWKFVRWVLGVEVWDRTANQLISSSDKEGREGHLTYQEAKRRALRTIKSDQLKKTSQEITDYILK